MLSVDMNMQLERTLRGLSIRKAARLTGLPTRIILEIENGKRECPPQFAKRLVEIYAAHSSTPNIDPKGERS